MRWSDSCGVCRVCAMEAGLALQSNFSSLPSRSCYPHIYPRNPTLCYTHPRFGPLHLTGASTKTRLEHKISFSISPCHAPGSLNTITPLISSTSSCYYWAIFSKDRQARISTEQGNSLNTFKWPGLDDFMKGR